MIDSKLMAYLSDKRGSQLTNQIKEHLESLWTGEMSWENLNTFWIIKYSSVNNCDGKTPSQCKKFNYLNLIPVLK